MNKKYIVLAFSVLAIMAVIYFVIYKKNVTTYITDDTYLAKVYPLLTKEERRHIPIKSLGFYYYPYPISLQGAMQNLNPHKPQKLNTLYCLSWMTRCGYAVNGALFRNLYDMRNTSLFKYRHGFPSDSLVEVIHDSWYFEPAIYYYQAKGTGIFLDVGKTLVASNKVDALKKLGLTDVQVLNVSNHYVYFDSSLLFGNSYNLFKGYAEKNKIPFLQALPKIMHIIIDNENYDINRAADSSSYDLALYFLCRKKHYDTIQFTTSPNDNGGWAYEIMDCRTSINSTLVQRWKKERKYLKQCNPLRTKECRPCQFKVPFKERLSCHM